MSPPRLCNTLILLAVRPIHHRGHGQASIWLISLIYSHLASFWLLLWLSWIGANRCESVRFCCYSPPRIPREWRGGLSGETAMASIEKRTRADGSTAYRVDIRIKRSGRIVHRESRTFDTRAQAKAWSIKREAALQDEGTLQLASSESPTVGQMIARYMHESLQEFGRTKREHLKFLANSSTGDWQALKITTSQLVDWVRRRRLSGTGAATVGNDLIWLGVVFRYGRAAWSLPLDMQVIEDATTLCRAEKLIGKSKRRERRPTLPELETLTEWFEGRDKRADLPMCELMWFAIYSARRQAEITRLETADNDTSNQTGLVRDLKHPREKDGNHRRFKYTPEAWTIMARQDPGLMWGGGSNAPLVPFPFNAKSVGTAFTRACKFCGIADLRFHDLRHEATSRLFEIGYQIPEAQQVTLHADWNNLRRYTQLTFNPGEIEAREARYRELARV